MGSNLRLLSLKSRILTIEPMVLLFHLVRVFCPYGPSHTHIAAYGIFCTHMGNFPTPYTYGRIGHSTRMGQYGIFVF